MQTHENRQTLTKVTVAVFVFILFNILVSTAVASEKESITPRIESNSEFGRTSKIIENNGSLNSFVKGNLSIVEHRLGKQWIIDRNSLECVSEEMRGDNAGACIVKAHLFGDKEAESMWAILVGEADENGGIEVRKIEFLKQSN